MTYLQESHAVLSAYPLSAAFGARYFHRRTQHLVHSGTQCFPPQSAVFLPSAVSSYILFVYLLAVYLSDSSAGFFFNLNCMFLLWLILDSSWVKYFTFSNAPFSLWLRLRCLPSEVIFSSGRLPGDDHCVFNTSVSEKRIGEAKRKQDYVQYYVKINKRLILW